MTHFQQLHHRIHTWDWEHDAGDQKSQQGNNSEIWNQVDQ